MDRRLWPWILGVALAAVAIIWVLPIAESTGPPEPGDQTIPLATDRTGLTGESTTEELVPGVLDSPGSKPGSQPPSPGTEPVPGAAAGAVIRDVERMRAAVRRYETDCANRPPPVSGTRERNIVAACLDRLSGAIDAVLTADTVGGIAAEARLERYRSQADELRRSAPGAGYSGQVRELLISSAELLGAIQEHRYPETLGGSGAVEELQSTAASMDPHQPVDAQQERLMAFFRDAAPILSAMARPADPGRENGTR